MPRIGGAPWYAGRALHTLGQEAVIFAKCGEDDRARFQRRLATLGLPASLEAGGETTSFSFSYDADGHRTMTVEAVGEPWRTDEPQSMLLRRVEWLHVAPLLRSDFDAAALERLARGRRVLLDGQGLVRLREVGPLELDAKFDPRPAPAASRSLKLAAEEAAVLAASDAGASVQLASPRSSLWARPAASSTRQPPSTCPRPPFDATRRIPPGRATRSPRRTSLPARTAMRPAAARRATASSPRC